MSGSLSQKELALIENLEDHQSQRRLAEATGFSLGMTNLLLKRLVKKGYVKVTTLNGRTLKYMLTPTGFAEKVQRSFDYMVGTIRFLNGVKRQIRTAVLEQRHPEDPVCIVGHNELAELAKEAVREAGCPFHSISADEWIQGGEHPLQETFYILCDPELSATGSTAELQERIVRLPALMGGHEAR